MKITMKSIVSVEDIAAMAFSGDELIHKELLTKCDILEAEERYIRPVVGDGLYEALVNGSYATLRSEYVVPALAAWCRYLVAPLLANRCMVCSEESVSSSDNVRLNIILERLAHQASMLTRRLSRHLNSHASDYEEYNSNCNPLNRCFIYGNIIQIR